MAETATGPLRQLWIIKRVAVGSPRMATTLQAEILSSCDSHSAGENSHAGSGHGDFVAGGR